MKSKIMPVQIQPNDQFTLHQATQLNLPINHAIQIQAAEYWLKLGEADLAMKELEKLPTRIWRCSWAVKTRIAAMVVLMGKDEMMVQA